MVQEIPSSATASQTVNCQEPIHLEKLYEFIEEFAEEPFALSKMLTSLLCIAANLLEP